MTDLINADWNEIDNDNTGLSPNGIASGYAPSSVAPILRAVRGAAKRNFVRTNPIYNSTGTGAAYVLTYLGAPTAYNKGEIYRFWAHIQNTGAATITINGLGAKSILSRHGSALTAGQIKANKVVEIVYNGTAFELLSGEIVNPKFEGTAAIVGDLSVSNTATTLALFSNTVTANVSTTNTATATTVFANTITANAATISTSLTANTLAGNGTALTALNGSNISTGTVADARLPTTMAGRNFTSHVFQDSAAGNPAYWLRAGGIDRGVFYTDVGTDALNIRKYSSTGAVQNELSIYGGAVTDLKFSGQTVWTAANDGSGSGLDAGLLEGQNAAFYRNGSNINAGTIAEARLPATTSQRTYPRRSDGGSINFIWSGQTGQPQWLWGGNDGTNMQVYNPSNFSVAWAANATNASDSALLGGQNSAFYRNGSNINAGTVADARLPGTMASKTITGSLTLPQSAGTNQFLPGNGDGANYATANIKLKGHYGMHMATHDDSVQGYYDFRAGKWDVKGGYYKNGVEVTTGAWEVISAGDIGGVTASTFTNLGAYRHLRITASLQAASGSSIANLRMSNNNGASWIATGYYWNYQGTASSSGSITNTYVNNGASVALALGGNPIRSDVSISTASMVIVDFNKDVSSTFTGQSAGFTTTSGAPMILAHVGGSMGGGTGNALAVLYTAAMNGHIVLEGIRG